ncbi:MAG: hypothetical protein OXH00_21660 [Candidatus Poribacteria bacterium]|nr:hypothetical protein [Candidatus Poribacteria bacterium]
MILLGLWRVWTRPIVRFWDVFGCDGMLQKHGSVAFGRKIAKMDAPTSTKRDAHEKGLLKIARGMGVQHRTAENGRARGD